MGLLIENRFFEENQFFIFSIILILIIIWIKKTWRKEQIPQMTTTSTLPFFKNIVFYWSQRNNFSSKFGVHFLQFANYGSKLYEKEKILKVSWGTYTYVFCFHPEVAQEVFKSYNNINKDWTYKILHNWLGTGLLTSSDDKWRSRRKLLTPAFHFRILEDFQDIFNEHSNVLIRKIKERKELEMSELVTLCTLDIVADSAMGVQLNAQIHSDKDYVKAVKVITDSIIQWFTKPWYWFPPFFYISPLGRKMRKNIGFVHEYTQKVILNRKQKLIEELEDNQSIDNFQEDREVLGIKKRRAFLDLLLYHHLTDGSLTELDIREEVDTFMFEGHDTTAMGISWTLYLLGLYEDKQEKVYQELCSIFGDDKCRNIATQDLKEMKYLERVIKESIRLYPSVPLILRKLNEKMKIGEYEISENSSIVLFIYGIHHNSEVFENPEIFDPDRFLQENCEKRHPFAYVPFSAGPRNCIGQRFAMNVLKTVCANVLRNFRIKSLEHRDKILISGDVILRPVNGIKMVAIKRI